MTLGSWLAVAVLTFGAAVGAPTAAADPPGVAATSVYLGVYIGCDNSGNLTSYRGVGTGLPGNLQVETYFRLEHPSGLMVSTAEKYLFTTSTGTVRTATYYPSGTYVGAQFLVYLPYPRDDLYQSTWEYCLAGCGCASTSAPPSAQFALMDGTSDRRAKTGELPRSQH